MANNKSPIAIKITNLPQIKRAFGQSPQLMATELQIAIKKSVFSVQRQSMINTPVATGRLRSSTMATFGYLVGEVGTHTNYDIFVHNGTKFMRGRPYLADAVESENDIVQQFFTLAVNNVLSRIARGTQ